MKKILSFLIAASIMLICDDAFARGGGFGGSRGGGGGRSSYSSGSSSRSSFGGSRSSGSSFGGSRSSGSSVTKSSPSKSSSFGGSRSSSTPAPIVRRSSPSTGTSNYGSSSSVHIYHSYGYGGYYGSPFYGGGFFHGFMWGQFFSRPQVVYVGGDRYIAGTNGQPMLDATGQPVPYQTNPAMTALAVLIWILILSLIVYICYKTYQFINGDI